jgi:hypothetical protein
MLTVATLLWGVNEHSQSFSNMYDESWVEKLYRGFARNLSEPFRFVCYTDRPYEFAEPVEQVRMRARVPTYADCIQPYELGGPMILVGLDTIVCGPIDHLARSCVERSDLGLPRDPFNPRQACNGVSLAPAGCEKIAADHWGENDMDWVRTFPHSYLDDEFPGQVVSYKGSVKKNGLGDARIVYFHGREKAHELPVGHALLDHWV